MKRIKLKKIKKIKVSTKITILIILISFCVIFLLNYINKVMYPILMKYATTDAKKMALAVLENSVDDEILNTLKKEEIFSVSENKNGEVSNIDFNPVVVNKVLSLTTNIVSTNFKKIEKGKIEGLTFINNDDYNIKQLKNGVISELPVGLTFNNSLLSNLGPKIPVKINLIGNVVSYVKTSVENYGINNAMIGVYAHVEVTEQVIIPFSSKEIKVVNNIPVALKIVQGTVPNYYGGSLNQNSSIFSLPVDIDNSN